MLQILAFADILLAEYSLIKNHAAHLYLGTGSSTQLIALMTVNFLTTGLDSADLVA